MWAEPRDWCQVPSSIFSIYTETVSHLIPELISWPVMLASLLGRLLISVVCVWWLQAGHGLPTFMRVLWIQTRLLEFSQQVLSPLNHLSSSKLTYFYLTPLSRNTNHYQRTWNRTQGVCHELSSTRDSNPPPGPWVSRSPSSLGSMRILPQLEELRMVVEVESPALYNNFIPSIH